MAKPRGTLQGILLGDLGARVYPIRPAEQVIAPVTPAPSFGFADEFARLADRTYARDNTSATPGDVHDAWGAVWSVEQAGNELGFPYGAGAGVDGAAGYYRQSYYEDAISFLAAATVTDLGVQNTMTILMRFRWTVKTPMGDPSRTWRCNVGVGLYLYDWDDYVQLSMQYEPDGSRATHGSEVYLSEWTGTYGDLSFSPSVGDWLILKWERSRTGDYSRVRIWRDGDTEPSTWDVEDQWWAPDPAADNVAIQNDNFSVYTGLFPVPPDDETLSLEVDYVRITS